MSQVIAYIRRSQEKRGQKWSLARQESTIKQFCEVHQLQIVEIFTETESGMKDDRVELKKALNIAENLQIPVIVSSVSRLGRKLSKLASIIENPQLKVICCDVGLTTSFLQLAIHSIFAAEERSKISRRTKEGISAARQKAEAAGLKFEIGNPRWSEAHCLPAAWEAKRAVGSATALKYGGLISGFRQLQMSWNSIAKELNNADYPTATGRGRWTHISVKRIHDRFIKEQGRLTF